MLPSPPPPSVGVKEATGDSVATQEEAGPGLAIGLALVGGCMLVGMLCAVMRVCYRERFQSCMDSMAKSATTNSPTKMNQDMAATHTGTLTKTPLGLGLTIDPDNIVACVKDGSQAEREGHIHVGDLVVALNGEVPAHGTGVTAIIQSLPMGAQLEFSLQSAAAREATKSLEPEALAEQRRRRAAASAEVEVKVSKPDQPQIRHI